MGYKVLYRKYRPTCFEDIIDQKFITDTLKESIINNKISHAYIFSGPKGTGKTSTAKVFAKAINCEHPVNGEPCGKCNSCINFKTNPDIIELDAASNNKVEDIRELISNVKLAPTNSKYKIYIIDEAHMLTNSASNAFLLTLEEPPAHDIFILATTNPESLPLTILSRCQQFAFSKISKKALIDRIKYVLKQEELSLTDDVIEEIALLADGGLRDALSILDQLLTLNKTITPELLTEQFGTISESKIEKLVSYIVDNDFSAINSEFSYFKEYGISEKSFINKFVSCVTNKICEFKESNNVDLVNKLKNIIFEIMKINTNRSEFNYYDVIRMIILSNLDSTKVAVKENVLNTNSVENGPKQEEITSVTESEKDISNSNKSNKDSLQEVNTNSNNNRESSSIDNLIKARINNSFVNVTKNDKIEFEAIFNGSLDSLKKENDIYSLIVDTSDGAVSPTNAIIICESEASANLLNEKLPLIDKKTNFKNRKLVFVSEDNWNVLKEDYRQNKNKPEFYKYIEEPKIKEKNDIKSMADDIFGDNMVVMEEE